MLKTIAFACAVSAGLATGGAFAAGAGGKVHDVDLLMRDRLVPMTSTSCNAGCRSIPRFAPHATG